MLQQMVTARSSLIAGAATVALGLAAAGCGGGGGGGATATTAGALSHQELVTQANAACTKASDAVTKVPAATTIPALATYATRVRAIGVTLHADLTKLTPPAEDRQTFQGYLDGLNASNQALSTMRTAAAGNDTDGVQSASEAIAGANIGVLAARAGLSSCATATKTPGS
jgi:hypothetical protein